MLMNNLNERRQTTRLTIETDVRISDQENNIFKGKIKNLSTIGALIQTDGQLQSDINYEVSIKLQGNSSNLLIDNLSATVVRYNADTCAIEFTDTMEWLTLFYVYRKKLKIDQQHTIPFQKNYLN